MPRANKSFSLLNLFASLCTKSKNRLAARVTPLPLVSVWLPLQLIATGVVNASQSTQKALPTAAARAQQELLAEPQLRVLSWRDVSRGSSEPELGPLFNVQHLAQFARPAHASVQMGKLDLYGYLTNSESSLGVDPTLLQLRNRSDLQLLPSLPMRAYFGLLHAHTFASDGIGTARSAFRTARDIARLDFFAVTDHSEYWLTKKNDVWHQQIQTASEESGPHFVAFAGFEYSHTLLGHMVVLNGKDWTNAYRTPTWSGFYDWLAQPEQTNALTIFAHPGFHGYRKKFDLAHFAFDPRLKDKMVGVEFIHKNVWRRSTRGFAGQTSFLDEALAAGWHVGPIASQDNHSEYWGIADSGRIALLLPELNRDAVVEALRERRFYATQSPQLQLAVGVYSGQQQLLATLGQSVDAAELKNDDATLRVRLFDPNPQWQLCRFDLLVNGVRARHLDFLNVPSSGYYFSSDKVSPSEEKNCAPAAPRQPWWERLLNNGIVTSRPFQWVFDTRPAVVPEVIDITTPLKGFVCEKKAGQSGPQEWRLVVKILHAHRGEKLTLTAPINVRCSSPAGAT